jgi:predicted GNAT family acetyltransferase
MGCLQKLGSADNDKLLDYLKRNEFETTLIIGNVKQFGIDNNKAKRRCGDYFGYIENGRLQGIIVFYNLGNCISHFENSNSIPFFSDIIKEKNVESLLGMSKYIAPIYEKIKDYKDIKAVSNYSYLINNNFKSFMAKDAVVVNCESVNRDSTIEFIIEANNLGFNKESTQEDALKTIKERSAEEDEVFVIKDSRIVAKASILGCTDNICHIGGVYTSAPYRGNGYCKAAVSEICRRVRKRGKVPSIMVRNDNIPALKAYETLGFEYYDDNIIIFFNSIKK